MVAIPFSDADLVRIAEKLPSAPRLLVELGALVQNPHVEADDVVNLLRRDQSLVARIIRLANSAAYSPSEPVGSLERAIAFVGFAEVHRLVGVVAAAQLAEQPMRLYPISGPRLRMHSLFTAVLMEELAKPANENPRRCYTVGLLRTIGMMALERLGASTAESSPFGPAGGVTLDEWEQQNWGTTNPEVAERILLRWKLPHETVTAVRHHYRPNGRHNPIIHLLTLAATAAADRDFGIPGEEIFWKPTPENFTKAGLDLASFQLAGERAQRKFEQLKAALG